MHKGPVFYDPAGTRKRYLTIGASLISLTVVVVASLFAASIVSVPVLPNTLESKTKRGFMPTKATKIEEERAKLLAKEKARLALQASLETTKSTKPIAYPGDPICAVFYAPWQESGIHSLRANAGKFSHLVAQWLHLAPDGKSVDYTTDFDPTFTPVNKEVIRLCKENGVKIMPILDNGRLGKFSPGPAHIFLNDLSTQLKIGQELKAWLLKNQFDGLNIDFEELTDADQHQIAKFLKVIGPIFRQANLKLSVDLESSVDPKVMGEIANECDWVVVMAYDEHNEEGLPGSIAALDWSEEVLQSALTNIPKDKLVLGVGNYAYDWEVGKRGATSLTYQEAITLAKENRGDDSPEDVIDLDPESLNTKFEYQDDDGKNHVVWLLDGISAFNQLTLVQKANVRGAAVWALGSEDPSIWNFLSRDKLNDKPEAGALETISFPYQIDYVGDGEILKVASLPSTGKRVVELDEKSGLVVDQTCESYPSSYVIKREGLKPKVLALTFDDGPDATYTPKILDKLKELGTPATFFVIGQNAEEHPNLMRRMVAEGHEVGSHSFTHPNLGTLSDRHIKLELNTTQRALQAILGRSTLLFRPPYYADAEPNTAIEVRPVLVAAELGYSTVGELIDPEDWLLDTKNDEGEPYRRTAEDIAEAIIVGAHKGEGNIILLHDAGGDRQATVRALEIAVPQLKQEGYRFALVSELLGKTTDQVMPPVRDKDLFTVTVDRLAFYGVFGFEAFLALAFGTAVLLGLARVFMIAPLALLQNRERRREVFVPVDKKVSVLIAAYNEAKVISRTIRSVMACDYPVAEILVIDDGSSDGTAEVVRADFAGDARVRLIQQENGGKASALNLAMEEAVGDIVVCVDADTQFAPNCIGLLVRHFSADNVGAVAGNVQVGNVRNFWTAWQAVEYTTSQNLDRRAQSMLNAVSVVPGAIGAWRKDIVLQAGGYHRDTLAEDMDLTWRVRELGYWIETESDAYAYTEAPETLKTLFKQRFRWAYGTLQCLWKHRKSLFRFGWFGWFTLPTLWLFQIGFNAIAPFVDLQVLYSLGAYLGKLRTQDTHSPEYQPMLATQHVLISVMALYFAFLLVEIVSGYIAYKLEKKSAKPLWSLLIQRFVYRQLMYAVIYRSLFAALAGLRQGWGKVDRTGSVTIPGK